jgi:hypothetical protein
MRLPLHTEITGASNLRAIKPTLQPIPLDWPHCFHIPGTPDATIHDDYCSIGGLKSGWVEAANLRGRAS